MLEIQKTPVRTVYLKVERCLMMKKYKDSLAVDIGLRLPHSQGTMEFLKRSNLELYFTLMKINGKDKVEFSDVMVLEHSDAGGNYYSCPLCKTSNQYSGKYGHAKKHFESHRLDIEKILKTSRINDALKFFGYI